MLRHMAVYINPQTALFFRGVSLLTLSLCGLLYLTFAVFLFLAFSELQEVFEAALGTLTNQKKPRKSLRRVQFPVRNTVNICRGQLGCREEFVSAAPVSSCRDCWLLSRVKLSRVTLPDLTLVRLGSPSSNTCYANPVYLHCCICVLSKSC